MCFAKKRECLDTFGYTKTKHMKAKLIILISAALVCVNAFSQPPKPETGVFMSTDQGETWKPAGEGLPGDLNISAWVVARNNAVFITTFLDGVYRSFDGKSWDRIGNGLPKDIVAEAIAVHGSSLFIGSHAKGIFASHDNGKTWKEASTGLDNMNVRCFYSQENKLFAGTEKGIYASENNGASWTHLTGDMPINNFEEADGVLSVGTNRGTLRSENRGGTWGWASADSVFVPTPPPTFRITPASPPMLLAPWKSIFRPLRENRPFQNGGLPANMPFNRILVTPFGILVSQKGGGC